MPFKLLNFLLQHISLPKIPWLTVISIMIFHIQFLTNNLELSLVWIGPKLALAFRSVSLQKFSFQEVFGGSACC